MENPKAILEYQLRNFTCLHEGDTITIEVFKDRFQIDILSITPINEYKAICIVDADVDVDFAPPLDYVEPQPMTAPPLLPNIKQAIGTLFAGNPIRIDQKTTKAQIVSSMEAEEEGYDPRKHRIHRGIRKTNNLYSGKGLKIG